MPIYEYRCNSCGAKKEHLQKMSDAPIAICPACGSSSYIKLISAAGFQLKGSGWYVTDFKNNNNRKPDSPKKEKSEASTTTVAAAPAASTSTSKSSTAD